jgi:Subtilase family
MSSPSSPNKKVVRLLSVAAPASELGVTAASGQIHVQEAVVADSDVPWQAAYEEYARRGGDGHYIEPEAAAEVPFRRLTPQPAAEPATPFGPPTCVANPQSHNAPTGPEPGWHLADRYSQLASARDYARKHNSLGRRVRIAHIDTGYDKSHHALPPAALILRDLSRDFTKNPAAPFADDPGGMGLPLDNRGHGTATLCILAGGPIKLLKGEPLGGAPDAEVLPLRISERVVLAGTGALASAVHYAIDNGCDAITLSMGGVASKFWVDAYNRAYEQGVFCVAAAGNHLKIGPLSTTPDSTVYPALFNRVISATGVMADGLPYDLPGTMSGNWGPHDKMRTALAAYTPNIPWAEFGCPDVVSEDGAGTSAATPQIAAAAALWLLVNGSKFPKDWHRAEAVRQALLQTAKSPGAHYEEFGRGILQARAALDCVPQGLSMEAADVIWLPWLKAVTGLGVEQAKAPAGPLEQMLQVEFAQLAMTDPGLMPLVKKGPNALSPREQSLVREYIASATSKASPQLRRYVQTGDVQAAPPAAPRRPSAKKAAPPQPPPASPGAPPPSPPLPPGGTTTPPGLEATRNPWTPPDPATRRLRIYALDPSYALQRSTAALAETTLEVPWDKSLAPGPVDEYLEVVDYDPSSECFYAPVNLNDPKLLAQDGLRPSPGNPLFHQQMAYAVARKTIDIFETALGRKVFWTGPPLDLQRVGLRTPPTAEKRLRYRQSADDDVFVQRLRIYPHALRQQNAFYSQRKGSLLFGYFPSTDEDRFGNEVVCACLSYDIVAHETTHAILDGINRTLVNPTNPDVLAFHEAFADIVALLSRFQMKEIVASQIAATRGNLNSESILGQLGREFGVGTGRFQALRTYLGRHMEEFHPVTRRDPISRYATDDEVAAAVQQVATKPTYQRKPVWQKTEPDPRLYRDTDDAHSRGAILVAAVYAALVSVYEIRAANLLRLAGAGDGPGCCRGEMPQALAELLTEELCQSATQVLNMCIRAIDYLPPVDITFGEYLRAIITADFDVNPEDRLHCRVAFVEAFRNWGIKVEGVQSASEDSLRWQTLNPGPFREPSRQLAGKIGMFVQEDSQYTPSRKDSFRVTRQWRFEVQQWLTKAFQDNPGFERLFGLDLTPPKSGNAPAPKFYVRALRRVERTRPDGRPVRQAVLQITQTKRTSQDGMDTWVTGGASLIVSTAPPGITYVILKKIDSKDRVQAAAETAVNLAEDSLRSTYFGRGASLVEPFAVVHEQED